MLQEVTVGYKWLERVTKGYRSDKGTQGVTRGYRG